MLSKEKFNKLKEINKKYGYGSWTLWPKDESGKKDDPKNKDVSFFGEMEKSGELFGKLTDKVMMLALNPSGDDNGAKPLLWENFRGGRYDYRISMLVEKFVEKKFKCKGCYITDLFKEKIGSSSKDAEETIRKWEKEGILREKVEPFVKELDAIGLDSLDWIIVFGRGTTYELLKNLIKDKIFPEKIAEELKKKVKAVTHYSFRYIKKGGYWELVKEQLKEQNVPV